MARKSKTAKEMSTDDKTVTIRIKLVTIYQQTRSSLEELN